MRVPHALPARGLGVVLLAATTSCTLGLSVRHSTTEEVVREPLGASVSVTAERSQDDLRVAVRPAERVRVTTFDVETVERRRTELVNQVPGTLQVPLVMLLDFILVSPVIDLGLGIAAPFRADVDVALGPLGVLLALLPGITLMEGLEKGEVWDVSTDRRLKDTREVTERGTGVATSLRIVTDREVFQVGTDAQGIATIPLARVFGPGLAPGRVTLAHGEDVFVVRFDGEAITVTPTAK